MTSRPVVGPLNWICCDSKCGRVNPLEQRSCVSCSREQPSLQSRPFGTEAMRSGNNNMKRFFADDWHCSICGNINFAHRSVCNICGTAKAEKLQAQSEQPSFQCRPFGSAAPGMQNNAGVKFADDWKCSICGNINFARRLVCHICNVPKTGKSEQRSDLAQQMTSIAYQPYAKLSCLNLVMKSLMEFEGVCCHVSSTDSFFVHQSNGDVFRQLQEKLFAAYDKLMDEDFVLQNPQKDDLCAVKYRKGWFRAIYLESAGFGDAKIKLIDIGKTGVVSVLELKSLDARFLKFPVQAIECGIASGNPHLSDATLLKKLQNAHLCMRITSNDGKVLKTTITAFLDGNDSFGTCDVGAAVAASDFVGSDGSSSSNSIPPSPLSSDALKQMYNIMETAKPSASAPKAVLSSNKCGPTDVGVGNALCAVAPKPAAPTSKPGQALFQSPPFPASGAANSCSSDDGVVAARNNEDGPLILRDHKGRLGASLFVPFELHGYLIGRCGDTKNRIADSSNTQIFAPKYLKDGNLFLIKGHSEADVLKGYRMLKDILEVARDRLAPTHFLGIPINGIEIQRRYLHFKDQVLQTCKESRGVSAGLFECPQRLHMEVGHLLPTVSPNQISEYATVLRDYFTEILKPQMNDERLIVRLCGLETFSDDTSDVGVLSAKLSMDESTVGNFSLQGIVNHMRKHFIEKGFMKPDARSHVKLHVPLMSATSHDVASAAQKLQRFDARKILSLYKDFDFGTHVVESIRLSNVIVSESDVDLDGFYGSIAKISLC